MAVVSFVSTHASEIRFKLSITSIMSIVFSNTISSDSQVTHVLHSSNRNYMTSRKNYKQPNKHIELKLSSLTV